MQEGMKKHGFEPSIRRAGAASLIVVAIRLRNCGAGGGCTSGPNSDKRLNMRLNVRANWEKMPHFRSTRLTMFGIPSSKRELRNTTRKARRSAPSARIHAIGFRGLYRPCSMIWSADKKSPRFGFS